MITKAISKLSKLICLHVYMPTLKLDGQIELRPLEKVDILNNINYYQ